MKVFGAKVFYASDYAPMKTLDGVQYLVFVSQSDAMKLRARGVDVLCDSDGSNYIYSRSYADELNEDIIPGAEYDLVVNIIGGGRYTYLDFSQTHCKEEWEREFRVKWDTTVSQLRSLNVDFSNIRISCAEVFSQK